MSRDERCGNRKRRSQKKSLRIPELGYYIIITDNEATERCFFEGLRNNLPKAVKDKLVIKVVNTREQEMIKKGIEEIAYDPQYRNPWIVFDHDECINFDTIINDAEQAGISVAWSNPCFEIWMFAYFGEMPSINESWTCCSKFGDKYKKLTGQEYSKSDSALYKRLYQYGNEEKAINIAKRKHIQHMKSGASLPSEMCPCTTVYELVNEIRSKCDQINNDYNN